MKINGIINNFIRYNNPSKQKTIKTNNNKNSKELINFTRNKIPVYVIDKNGDYKRYNSETEAAAAIGVTMNSVSSVLSYKSIKTKGFSIEKATKLEKKNKDGSITLDTNKIKEIAKNINDSIYVVDKKGNYKKFSSRKEAMEAIGCSYGAITHILRGNYGAKTIKGYSVIEARELETKDKKGNITVNKEKIKELIKNLNKGYYTIAPDGKYQKYSSQVELAQSFGVNQSLVCQVLNGRIKTLKGYRIIRASDIETFDKNNNLIIDNKKLNKILKITYKG